MAGPHHLPEGPWEGARLFPRNGWVGVSYPLALPGCTLSISETPAPAHFQLSHVPCKFFSHNKSSLSCACLPCAFPCLVLLAASDSPCPQSPCEGGTLWDASASSGSREFCWHRAEEAAALWSQKPHTAMSLDTRETPN